MASPASLYALRVRAQAAVSKAMLAGELPRPTRCEACGREARQRDPEASHSDGRAADVVNHHWSYQPQHWLDVIPMCRSCHRSMHAGSLPEPRTGRLYRRGPDPQRPSAAELVAIILHADCPHCGSPAGAFCVGTKKRMLGQVTGRLHAARIHAATVLDQPVSRDAQLAAKALLRRGLLRDFMTPRALLRAHLQPTASPAP